MRHMMIMTFSGGTNRIGYASSGNCRQLLCALVEAQFVFFLPEIFDWTVRVSGFSSPASPDSRRVLIFSATTVLISNWLRS